MTLLLVLLAVVAYLAGVGLAIGGSVDTFQFTPEAWDAAGYRRLGWVWQAAGALCVPAGLIYSGVYFLHVRPRVARAQALIARRDPSYEAWLARRRWYDRLVWARRSPDRWERAARLWWWNAIFAVPAVALALLWATLVGQDSARHLWRLGAWLNAGTWAAIALVSAVRAGFWYAEHMRLTGRRPAAGGPLTRRDEPGGRNGNPLG